MPSRASAADHPPGISVVVAVRDRAHLLARTLDCLAHQRLPADDVEVVVSTDGSDDVTTELVRAYADRLRLLCDRQESLGARLSAARNGGARRSTGPLLAFLDAGTLPGPDYVRALLEAHRRRCAITGYLHGFNWFSPAVTPQDELAQL